ncbi:MAG: RlpA-like double-psi beta-barrel domain-containing protein [Minisyncoccota bacterium]
MKERPITWSESGQKNITVIDDGLEFSFSDVQEKTVDEFLQARQLGLKTNESVFPPMDVHLFSGTSLFITRTHPISVRIDGETRKIFTTARSVEGALRENDIILNEDDIVVPDRFAFAGRDVMITVTRVVIEEQSIDKILAFEKKVSEDEKLSWRKNIVTQKGENGTERSIYRVSMHDSKEVNRKLIRTERIKDPVPEIITQGTYIQVGKTHKGAASWYAYTGTLSAANPWLPIGSSVRVTNLDNGKSVIVRINDRGPFGIGRIIDLDKTAFARIASLGQGVINVKMEEITN